jgi:hypothetical protein
MQQCAMPWSWQYNHGFPRMVFGVMGAYPAAQPIEASRFVAFRIKGRRGIPPGAQNVMPLIVFASEYCPEAFRASLSNGFRFCKTSQHNLG